jgi:DNA-binding response OmpR family regulator
MQDIMPRPRILLIEDDSFIIEIVEACLLNEFDITSVQNGLAGLNAAVTQKPDLVILDIILPEMNGFDACIQIRTHPELTTLPILILTAKDNDEDRMRGFESGCDDYLGKPFNLEELVLRIKALLRRSGLNLADNNRFPGFGGAASNEGSVQDK